MAVLDHLSVVNTVWTVVSALLVVFIVKLYRARAVFVGLRKNGLVRSPSVQYIVLFCFV